MESNPHEDSKSSSEETDRSEHACDDMGTGRSYECVFCKRGFTTAQALGGHMNIHRKDRAKNRPSSVPNSVFSDKVDHESYASFRSFSTFQSYPNHYAMASEVQLNYQTCLPAPTWGTERPLHPHHSDIKSYGRNSQHLNPFGDDVWRGNLGGQVGSSLIPDDGKEKREGASEEDELDLELRLGHDP